MKFKFGFFVDLHHNHSQEEGFFAFGIMSVSVSPIVHRKLFIDSAMSVLVEMCFRSMFMNELLVRLDSLFKTLLIDGFPCFLGLLRRKHFCE